MKTTRQLSKDLPPNAPAEPPAAMGTDISPCDSAVTSSMETTGFEGRCEEREWGPEPVTPPPPHHCPTSCQHLTFPQRKQGPHARVVGVRGGEGGLRGVAAAAWQAPGPQHVWGEMGGSPGDAIQALSLGGKSQRKTCIYNMNFPLLLPLS